MAAVASSTSVASTRRPMPAKAIASAPIPLVRSATRVLPASRYRRAWCAATLSRVACSSPAAVKSMPSANVPNFPAAFARRRDCVSAAATRAGSMPSSRMRSERASVRLSS